MNCDNCHQPSKSELCYDCSPVEIIIYASVSRDEWEEWKAKDNCPAYITITDSVIGSGSLQLDGSSIEEVQETEIME